MASMTIVGEFRVMQIGKVARMQAIPPGRHE